MNAGCVYIQARHARTPFTQSKFTQSKVNTIRSRASSRDYKVSYVVVNRVYFETSFTKTFGGFQHWETFSQIGNGVALHDLLNNEDEGTDTRTFVIIPHSFLIEVAHAMPSIEPTTILIGS